MKRSPLPRRAAPMPRTSMKPQGVSLKTSKPVPVQPQDPSTLAPRLATAPKRVAKPRGSKTGALRAYEREFERMRGPVLERSEGRCEAQLPGCVGLAPFDPDFDCGGVHARALNVHHRLSRQQGGGNELINLLHCCSACHPEAIHVQQQPLARSWGLLLRAGDDPEAIPVRRGEAAA